MKKFYLIFTLIILALPLAAQVQIKGTVIEDATGDPIIGASVIVKGSLYGTTTDTNGFFSMKAKNGQTLIISYVGMERQEIKVDENQTTLNIKLKENSEILDDVVVVGYGVTRKRDVAGAISQIKTEDIKAGVVTNTAELLKGRAAGVVVRQTSLEPGGNLSVRVRGASSISSNNDPLYVIDGLQTTAGNQVSPDDIESMEILKDAAATAIYGSRGANGVVIITTKKGKKDRFSLDYSFDMSTKFLSNPWKLMNAEEEIAYKMKVWRENGGSGSAPFTEEEQAYKGAGTDWVNEVMRTASTKAHGVTLSGGTDRIQAAATIVYVDDDGILPNTNFNRLSSRLNVDFKITDRIRAGANYYMAKTKKNYLNMGTSASTDNVLYWVFMADPIHTPTGINIFGNEDRSEAVYSEIQNKDFVTTVDNSYVTLFAEADILKSLTAKVQYSFSQDNSKYSKYYSRATILGSGYNGMASVEQERNSLQQLDAVLTYHQKYNDAHDLKLIGGTSYIANDYEYLGSQAHDFTTDAFAYNNLGAASSIDWIGSARQKKRNVSFFGRAEYVFKDRYIFNASIRADGASNFGKGNKWGYFPSASAAWQLGDEAFMKFIKPTVNTLKIRASYGRSGNDGIGNYKALRTYAFENVYLGGANIIKGMYPSNAGNNNLKWETTSQIDLGFDLALLNNKLEVNFDWYYKKTTDLLNEINISTSTSGLATTTGNNGSIFNRGVELFVKYNAINTKNFSWKTTLNISSNHNEVLKIEEPTYYTIRPHGTYNYEEYMMIKEGNALSSIYGYKWLGIIQEGETYAAQPNSQPGDPKFEDVDGDGVITPKDRTKIGDGAPKVVFGWGNNLRYKDFDFSFFFDASVGNSLLNLTKILLEDNNRLSSCANRWTKTNPSSEIIRSSWQKDGGLQYGSYVNSHYVENASYLRLSNIELGYNVPTQKLGIKFVKSCRFFVGAQRLFTITNYSGFDPEVSVNGASAVTQGLDFNAYPSYRTFNCGAKISF